MSKKIHLFDYGNIKDEHKDAATEIAELANQLGQSMLAELIKQKFQLVEPKRYDVENSSFVKECRKAGIPFSFQGFIVEGSGIDTVQYQLCTINEDIRKLDAWVENLKNENNKI